jgi:hypothetical protein
MKCEDAKLKIQALIDKELNENEIEETLAHTESCYKCRNVYIQMLKLDKKLQGVSFPEAEYDWYGAQRKKFLRRIGAFAAKIVILFSFLALFAWGIIELVKDRNTIPIIRISVAALIFGVVVLLFVTMSDRSAEKKHDKYKGVMK